jgi:hypothetical protein
MMGVRLNSGRTEWNLHEEATKIKASFGGREAEGVDVGTLVYTSPSWSGYFLLLSE